MATTQRAFIAGFMAATRLYETEPQQATAQESTPRPKRQAPRPETVRQGGRALESYLTIPTFIRQGRAIGL